MKKYTVVLFMMILGMASFSYSQEESQEPIQSMTEKMRAHTEKHGLNGTIILSVKVIQKKNL